MFYNIKPEDWTRTMVTRAAVDTPVACRIRYTGSEVAAHVSIGATTGDMTFEQGASTAAAATTTGDNPILPIGGTTGVIDISDTESDNLFKVIAAINLADDWEAWAVDLPGDYDTEISAGHGIFTVGGLSDQDCTGDTGFAVVVDTSLKTAEDFAAGVTFNGPCTEPHGSDANALHEIIKISATATFGGDTDGIYIYECDDIAGTKTQIGHLALASATATDFDADGEPMFSTKGKRLVVMAKDVSGAITSPNLEIYRRSYHFGPGIRDAKLPQNLGY